MPIFRIHAIATASKFLGEIEADTVEEAIEKAEESDEINNNAHMSLCHHCAGDIELGDIYTYEADKSEGSNE